MRRNLQALSISLFLPLLQFTACRDNEAEKKKDFRPMQEYSHRMLMTKERLTTARYRPKFTDEFILGDVNIDTLNPRRFYNYSGDLSGRYIEALATYYKAGELPHLKEIVYEVLKYQKSDGRFGDTSLIFIEKLIGREHMPLLWGNGRMLVGLLEYFTQTNDSTVLRSAVRLGDFFLGSYRQVTGEVSKRLEGLGADGIICFTQYVEPLVKLSKITGERKYSDAASEVYKILPSRGILHSHGYLTTLRGVLELYEYTGEKTHLQYVTDAYNDLVNSSDFTVYGSVQEYFGGRGERDEGCSTADFIRLSLHLYKITGNTSYLEKAEFALYNSLYYNQFFTGDFGHHTFDANGSFSITFNAAWWCCTMAGLRAMQVIRDNYFIEKKGNSIRVNLFLDTDYSDEDISFSLRRTGLKDGYHSYEIKLTELGEGKLLEIRKPSWAGETEILLNGEKSNITLKDNCYFINNKLNSGDVLEVRMKYIMRIIRSKGNQVLLNEIDRPVTGALCYGPYLMGIDNNLDYTFLAEPSNNYIYSNTLTTASADEKLKNMAGNSFVGDIYLTAYYKHGGFPSYYQTVMRPVSEMTFSRHPYMMIILQFVPESAVNARLIDRTMLVPWME